MNFRFKLVDLEKKNKKERCRVILYMPLDRKGKGDLRQVKCTANKAKEV